MNIVNKFWNLLSKLIYPISFWIVGKRRLVNANNRLYDKPQKKLTPEEKEEYNKIWKGYKTDSLRFYKAFGCNPDVKLVPNDYYDFAEHVLNLRWSSFFLQHKCSLKYIIPYRNRPKTILQKIDGHFVYEDNEEISYKDAENLLRRKDVFIFKIAMDTGGGRGVQKVCLTKEANPEEYLERLLQPENLIFQEILSQSDFMASFNPDSVNTFRLLTLNINGKATVLSSFVRMGARGSFVDNLLTGGGALVGVDQDGNVNEFGIRKNFSKIYEAPSGIKFKGLKVPNWNEIKEKVLDFHRHIPYANLIGWDIAIDKENEPVVIEINLDSGEVEAHQVFNGPVFGDRFDEVKQYIEYKKPLLRRAMIYY